MGKALDSADIAKSSGNAPRVSPWMQMDPWFWPMVFVGALATMYYGWALEDIYSLRLGWSNNNQSRFIYPQLLVGVVGGTALLTILLTIVYSPTALVKRLLSSLLAIGLILGCHWLSVGALRHDKLDDAISFYNRIHWQLNYLLAPAFFVGTSYWLSTVIIPIKLYSSKQEALNVSVDRNYQVNKFYRITCIAFLFFAWIAVQTGAITSILMLLPPIFIGMGLAFIGYIGLLLIAMFASAVPHGRFVSWLLTQIILIAAAFVAWKYGAKISQALLTAARYSDAVAAISTVSIVSLMFWFSGLYFTGRMPRIVRKVKTGPTVNKTTGKRGSFLAAGILILTSTCCFIVAHYSPFLYDLPLAIASKGEGLHHAKLAADLRRLTGSLIYDRTDLRSAARVSLPDDLADPSILIVTLRELDSADWKAAIARWQKEQRMPNLATNEKLSTISQLELFRNTHSMPVKIDGSKIDSRKLDNIKNRLPSGANYQTILFNTHVDQAWINFLDSGSLLLTFTNCTFEPGLKLPERKRLFWNLSFHGGTLNDQTLQILQNLDPKLNFLFESIEDLQLSLSQFESFTTTRELVFLPVKPKEKLEIQADAKAHFLQLSFPDKLIEAIVNRIDARSDRFILESLPYGEAFPLPRNANIPAFATDAEGNLIRYSDLSGTHNYKAVALTKDIMKDVETLQLNSLSLAKLVERDVVLPSLKRLDFTDLTNIDAMASPNLNNFDYFLKNINQERLVELQIPYLLDSLLDECRPWSNAEKLEIVLNAPPTLSSLNQIKTATQLKSLRICCLKIDDWSPANIGKQKRLWTKWLTTAGITVPTRVVFHVDQLAHPAERANATNTVDEDASIEGPEIELQLQR